jgi:hypothetical protein
VIGIVNGQFSPVATHQCPGTVVFCGPPGSYLVYGVEKDDSGEQKQFQTVVQIGGSSPPPVPPNPDPPGPDPPAPTPTPLPDGVENAYAIAEPAFGVAMYAGTVADVERLAKAYRNASQFLHEQRLTPEGAQRQLRQVRQQLGGDWSEWERKVESALNKAIAKYGSGMSAWRDYCREIAGALEAAAKYRQARLPRMAPPGVIYYHTVPAG